MSKEKGFCSECGKEIEVEMCCSGHECGCMGLPVEPPVCSSECYDKFMEKGNRPMEPFLNKDGLYEAREIEPIGITKEYEAKAGLTFSYDTNEIMKLCANGEIYIRGVLITNDLEVVEGMKKFLKEANFI
jgi:hypothetical protein